MLPWYNTNAVYEPLPALTSAWSSSWHNLRLQLRRLNSQNIERFLTVNDYLPWNVETALLTWKIQKGGRIRSTLRWRKSDWTLVTASELCSRWCAILLGNKYSVSKALSCRVRSCSCFFFFFSFHSSPSVLLYSLTSFTNSFNSSLCSHESPLDEHFLNDSIILFTCFYFFSKQIHHLQRLLSFFFSY